MTKKELSQFKKVLKNKKMPDAWVKDGVLYASNTFIILSYKMSSKMDLPDGIVEEVKEVLTADDVSGKLTFRMDNIDMVTDNFLITNSIENSSFKVTPEYLKIGLDFIGGDSVEIKNKEIGITIKSENKEVFIVNGLY